MSGLVPLLGGVVPNSSIFGELEATIAAQAATIAGLEGEIDDLEETIEEMEGAGFRQIGQIDFRTLTPTVITATPTVVDGVTFGTTSLGGQPAISAAVALTINASGAKATGANTTDNRCFDVPLADICDEVLDPAYSYAFTVEVSGPPQILDTILAMIGDGTSQAMGAGVNDTHALGWQMINGGYGGVVSVAHGGTIRQVGMTVSPGGRTGTLVFTATASAGDAQRPAQFTSPVPAVSHGTINVAAVTELDTLFFFMTPATVFLERISVWTDKPTP